MKPSLSLRPSEVASLAQNPAVFCSSAHLFKPASNGYKTPLPHRKKVNPSFKNIFTASCFPTNSLKFRSLFLKGAFLSEGRSFFVKRKKTPTPPAQPNKNVIVSLGVETALASRTRVGRALSAPPDLAHREDSSSPCCPEGARSSASLCAQPCLPGSEEEWFPPHPSLPGGPQESREPLLLLS